MTTTADYQTQIDYLSQRDFRLGRLIACIGNFDLYEPDDPFEFLASEIIEQMLSKASAGTIEARVRAVCGGSLTQESVGTVSAEQLRATGLSKTKAAYLLDLAATTTNESLDALAQLDDDAVRAALMKHKGIGRWTTNMFLLFYLQRNDVLPIEDVAFQQGFKWLYGVSPNDETAQRLVCDLWHPYASMAARYLYHALDDGLVRNMDVRQLLE